MLTTTGNVLCVVRILGGQVRPRRASERGARFPVNTIIEVIDYHSRSDSRDLAREQLVLAARDLGGVCVLTGGLPTRCDW